MRLAACGLLLSSCCETHTHVCVLAAGQCLGVHGRYQFSSPESWRVTSEQVQEAGAVSPHLNLEKAHSTCAAWRPLQADTTSGGDECVMKSYRKRRPGCQPDAEEGSPSPGA